MASLPNVSQRSEGEGGARGRGREAAAARGSGTRSTDGKGYWLHWCKAEARRPSMCGSPSMLPRPGPLKAWVLLFLSSVGPFFPPLLPLYPANSYSFFKAHQL